MPSVIHMGHVVVSVGDPISVETPRSRTDDGDELAVEGVDITKVTVLRIS